MRILKRQFKLELLDERGFGLIEAFVTLGIVGGVGLMAAQIAHNTTKIQTNERNNFAFQTQVTLALRMLQSPRICNENLANFENIPVNTGALSTFSLRINEIRGPRVGGGQGPVILRNGGDIIPRQLTVQRLELRNFQEVNTGRNYWAEVSIEAAKNSRMSVGRQVLRSRFTIPIEIDPVTRRIRSCGLREPPQPLTVTGCWGRLGPIPEPNPCNNLEIDGFRFESAGFEVRQQDLRCADGIVPGFVRTVTCRPRL